MKKTAHANKRLLLFCAFALFCLFRFTSAPAAEQELPSKLIKITSSDELVSVFAKDKDHGTVLVKKAAAAEDLIRRTISIWTQEEPSVFKLSIISADSLPETGQISFVQGLLETKIRIFTTPSDSPAQLACMIARGYLSCIPEDISPEQRTRIANNLPEWLTRAAMYKSLYSIYENNAPAGGNITFKDKLDLILFLEEDGAENTNYRRSYFVAKHLFQEETAPERLETFLTALIKKDKNKAIKILIPDLDAFFQDYSRSQLRSKILKPRPDRPTIDRIKSMNEIYSILRFRLKTIDGVPITKNSRNGYYYFVNDLPLKKCCRIAIGRKRLAQMYTKLVALKLRSRPELHGILDRYLTALMIRDDVKFRWALKRAERKMKDYCSIAPDEAAELTAMNS